MKVHEEGSENVDSPRKGFGFQDSGVGSQYFMREVQVGRWGRSKQKGRRQMKHEKDRGSTS